MQSLQSIAVINGRPSVWGDGFLALIMASPLYRDHDEYYEVADETARRRDTITVDDLKHDDTAAVCTFWRHGKPLPTRAGSPSRQAKKANLLGKEGPWRPIRIACSRCVRADLRVATRSRTCCVASARRKRRSTRQRRMTSTSPRLAPNLCNRVVPVNRVQRRPHRRRTRRRLRRPQVPTSTAAAAPSTATTGQELRGLKITGTSFVARVRPAEPYYEVAAQTATGTEKKFLTRDERVYKEAASFEGTDHLVVLAFHPAKLGDASVLALDRIAIYEGAAPAQENGALFG
jgi:hypothetical protein